MIVVTTKAQLRQCLGHRRQSGAVPVGLAATMGALHQGHNKLIETARQQCRTVVVTIFVNPLQFNNPEDLDNYPNTIESDLAICRTLCADIVFIPDRNEMYPTPPECTVMVNKLGMYMEGQGRPGHFDGVATVVLKLFMLIQPDLAYFGEKDVQQLAIVRRMVTDFNLSVDIVGVPTVRESDGLAMSSRNLRLCPSGRLSATALYRSLQMARDLINNGNTNVNDIVTKAKKAIPDNDPNIRLEYLDIVDPKDMQLVEQIGGSVVIAGALWVNGVRLIDNIQCIRMKDN